MSHNSFSLDLVRNSHSKSYLFVKLTDSALTAIEEYSKTIRDEHKGTRIRPATIQFHSNRGVISFPGECQDKRYSFSMSSLDADGSIEFIRQSTKGWQSLGNLACKLQIHAEEDIYQKTKSKVAAAEQESRRYCTKVLELTGNNMLGGRSSKRSKLTSSQDTSSLIMGHGGPLTSNNGSQSKKAKTSHVAPLMQKSLHLMSGAGTGGGSAGSGSSNIQSAQQRVHNSNLVNSNNQNFTTNNNHSSTTNNSKIRNAANSTSSASSNRTSSNNHTSHHNTKTTSNNKHINKDISTTIKPNINNNSISKNNKNNNNTGNYDTQKSANSHNSRAPNNLAEIYSDIRDAAQLRKYKAEFDKDFVEYQRLHQYLHNIERKFYNLESSLKTKVDGSEEWEATRDEIFREYDKIKSDNDFHRARSNYTHLHDKLAHIKSKIFQYKQVRRNSKRK